MWEEIRGAAEAKVAGGPQWEDVVSSMYLTEVFIRNDNNVSLLIIVKTGC